MPRHGFRMMKKLYCKQEDEKPPAASHRPKCDSKNSTKPDAKSTTTSPLPNTNQEQTQKGKEPCQQIQAQKDLAAAAIKAESVILTPWCIS